MNLPATIVEALLAPGPTEEVFCHFVQGGTTTTVTRRELLAAARRHAVFFRSHGVQPADVVSIILPHTPELLYAFLGAMLAGAVPSFMPVRTNKQDPQLYWRAHRNLFQRIGGAILTNRENLRLLQEQIPDLGGPVLAIEDVAGGGVEFISDPIAPHQTAFLQHSSGTTGLKKGVALSHEAVLRQIRSYARALQLTRDDRIVSWLPLYHDMGLIACFMLPLVTRTPVVLLDPFQWVIDPTLLFDAIKQHRGTLCWQPNFAFHHLCRTVRPSARLDLAGMRAWINCSEPCRPETFELFARTFAAAGVKREHLQVCYAMAETVFAVTQTGFSTASRTLSVNADSLRTHHRACLASEAGLSLQLLSTGRPIAGLQVRITGEHAQALPEGEVGEICVQGDCLFSGYFRLEEETARKLRNGWYHTGDLGFLHEGELFVTGRKNDLIIVHGRNYYAHELEHLINQIPGIHPGRNVAVGWYRAEVGSEEVVILAESTEASNAAQPSLATAIRKTLLTGAGLQVFEVKIVPPGWLVKTTSGKISRVENLHKYLAALAEPAALSV